MVKKYAAKILFADCRVEADSVRDFVERFYQHRRLRGRGDEYAEAVIASAEEHYQKYEYCIISRHDSKTGEVVAWPPLES